MKHVANMHAYLSDLVVFYMKLHDLHWNVKGMQFVPVHQYSESRYNDMAAKFDEIAELLLQHGEKPVSSISEYVKLFSIKELNKGSYRDEEVLKIIADDMAQLKAAAEALRLKMVEEDVFDIVAVLEDHITGCSRELWALSSIMA